MAWISEKRKKNLRCGDCQALGVEKNTESVFFTLARTLLRQPYWRSELAQEHKDKLFDALKRCLFAAVTAGPTLRDISLSRANCRPRR